MKIMLAAVAFPPEMSGVQRHAANAVRCLLTQPEITSIRLVIAPWQRDLVHLLDNINDPRLQIDGAVMKDSAIKRSLWYSRDLPALAAARNVDLVHLAYPVPVRSKVYRMPVVVTLHDLYPYEIPRNFSSSKILFNRIILRQCLQSVDAIACVSRITLQRLQEYLPSAPGQRAYIPNAVMPPHILQDPSPLHECEGTPFLLCVAQHRRNKNIVLLLRAFAALRRTSPRSARMKLLVVGIEGPETAHLRSMIEQEGLQNDVLLRSGLSESEMQWCYTHCAVFVAPSITEGFGLPLAEAMLAGSRIVCSDIPAFRELGQEHCRFVALGDAAEQRFLHAITEALLRPKPAPLSLQHLSVNELGPQYIALYRRAIAACHPLTQHADPYGERLPG